MGNKPDKYGIIFRKSVDIDHKHLYNGFSHLGKEDARAADTSLSCDVVLKLMNPLYNSGYWLSCYMWQFLCVSEFGKKAEGQEDHFLEQSVKIYEDYLRKLHQNRNCTKQNCWMRAKVELRWLLSSVNAIDRLLYSVHIIEMCHTAHPRKTSPRAVICSNQHEGVLRRLVGHDIAAALPLTMFDSSRPLLLCRDASDKGIGAVLSRDATQKEIMWCFLALWTNPRRIIPTLSGRFCPLFLA